MLIYPKQRYSWCFCWHAVSTVSPCLCKASLFMHSLCSLCIVHASHSKLSRFSALRAGVAVSKFHQTLWSCSITHWVCCLCPPAANTRLLQRHHSCAYSAFSNSTQHGRAITALATKPSTPPSVTQSTPAIHHSPHPLPRPLHHSPLEMQARHCPQHCGLVR